jgi:hypothetical protein
VEINLNTAITIWRTDYGYRTINSFLIGSMSNKDYIYHQTQNKTINYLDKTYNTLDIINIIKQNMKASIVQTPEIYYRGGSSRSKKSFVKESFISVSSDEEQAHHFVDGDCCLFKIIVDPSVKRYNTGIEYETLLENGLFWNYIGEKGKYHLIEITPYQPQLSSLSTPKIEKDNLTEEELVSLLDLYKDECILVDSTPTPEGFVVFIQENTFSKCKISIEIASAIIRKKGGKNTKLKNKTKTKKITKKQKLIKKHRQSRVSKMYHIK